jgi:hypothetical protein
MRKRSFLSFVQEQQGFESQMPDFFVQNYLEDRNIDP